MRNPFYFRELPLTAPFCDRNREIAELMSHAKNRANVVLFSPRRYGKTSLVKRIQNRLQKKGVFTIYVDLFGVDSAESVTARLASQIYATYKDNEHVLKKVMRFLTSWRPVFRPDPEYGFSVTVERASSRRGKDLLDETFTGLGDFVKEQKNGCHIVMDEFQEIVELKESARIEGVLRSHIQTHSNASYFFVGSRRRILSDMFNQKKRPFYRSAINYPLPPLPIDECVPFIMEQFQRGHKTCQQDIARRIAERVKGYPYYVQRICYAIFEISGKKVTTKDYSEGIRKTLAEEKPVYEAMMQALAPQQTRLLKSLSEEPTDSPYSADYMARHNLGSIGGVQGAIKKLTDLDYIEKKDTMLQVVDPLFAIWVRHLKD